MSDSSGRWAESFECTARRTFAHEQLIKKLPFYAPSSRSVQVMSPNIKSRSKNWSHSCLVVKQCTSKFTKPPVRAEHHKRRMARLTSVQSLAVWLGEIPVSLKRWNLCLWSLIVPNVATYDSTLHRKTKFSCMLSTQSVPISLVYSLVWSTASCHGVLRPRPQTQDVSF